VQQDKTKVMLEIRKAKTEEIERVINYYHNVIDAMEGSKYNPCWKKNIYPSDEYIKKAVTDQNLFLGFDDGRIATAMMLDNKANPGYVDVDWQREFPQHEIMVVHIFGVHPYFTGKGYAKQMLARAIEYARETGQKALRLDVLSGSVPAKKLYEKMGFKEVQTIDMFYEDTGWTKFDLYEYLL